MLLPDMYCCACGKMVRYPVTFYVHLIPEKAFADCYGPLTSCPPPDDEGRSIPDDSESEEEEPEPDTEELYTYLSQYPNYSNGD